MLYYLVQDLKCLVFSLIALHFKVCFCAYKCILSVGGTYLIPRYAQLHHTGQADPIE